MALVYILSTYEEHGAEDVVATLDPGRLEDLIDENWAGLPLPRHWTMTEDAWRARMAEWTSEAKAALRALPTPLEAPLSVNLHRGWGGMQLHVVNLS